MQRFMLDASTRDGGFGRRPKPVLLVNASGIVARKKLRQMRVGGVHSMLRNIRKPRRRK